MSAPTSPSASAYPFPHQDIQILPRRGPLRRGSTSSTISSRSNTTTIAESYPNAISTLLQPPINRTGVRPSDGGFKPPTQKDIPPVTLTNIPHVDNKAFDSYLSQVGSLYEAFQRAKNETEENGTVLFQRAHKDKHEDWEAVLSKKLQRPPHSRLGSVASIPSSPIQERPSPARRRSSAQKQQTVTPLSTVPSVYSEENFQLENPRTFDIVSENAAIVRDPNAAPSGRKSLVGNAVLQDKLSWYMDTVEVHLVTSISAASKSFFSALGSLKELHHEADESVVKIRNLRSTLSQLDKGMAVGGLELVKLKQRYNNIRALAEAMLQLEDIVEAVRQCESMIEDGRNDDVLDNIDDIERMIGGQATKFRQPSDAYISADLRTVNVLGSTLNHLNTLRGQAGRSTEARFHRCMLNDMRTHVQSADPKATLQRWGSSFTRQKPGQKRAASTFPTYMNLPPTFRPELEAAVRSLTRAQYTTPAVTTFKLQILKEMKNTIRRQLPSSDDDDEMTISSATTGGGRRLNQQQKSIILARNIRAQDSEDWYETLTKVYTNVSESLRRLSVQVKILLDITSTMDQSSIDNAKPSTPNTDQLKSPPNSRPRAKSVQAEMQQALDLSSLLGEAVDTIQSQITKVLKVRSTQNHEMSLQRFIRYATLNRLFAEECEAISGRSGQGFRTELDKQIRDYCLRFTADTKQKLQDQMDSDKWEAKDFSPVLKTILDRVVDGASSDSPVWLLSSQIWLDEPPATNGNHEATSIETPKVRSAQIEEQRFVLTASPTELLVVIDNFLHLTVGVGYLGTDLASSLCDVLRGYNSRSLQLILGAGATRTAGLKNITTKHLALSSLGLSFVIALVPYIREFFRRYVTQAAAQATLTEFDKAKRSLQEHQASIHEKLFEIMAGQCAKHIRSWSALDLSNIDKEAEASRPIESLCKETATLQKVLGKYLDDGIVQSIMIPVFSQYKQQWLAAIGEIRISNDDAKGRLGKDMEFVQTKMQKLEGSGDLGAVLVQAAVNKNVDTTQVNDEQQS